MGFIDFLFVLPPLVPFFAPLRSPPFPLPCLQILLRLLVNEDPEAGIHDEYLCRGAAVDVARRERKEHPAREALEDRVVVPGKGRAVGPKLHPVVVRYLVRDLRLEYYRLPEAADPGDYEIRAVHPDALAFIEYLDVDFLEVLDLVPAEFDREGVLEYHLVEPAAEVFPDFFGEGFDLE